MQPTLYVSLYFKKWHNLFLLKLYLYYTCRAYTAFIDNNTNNNTVNSLILNISTLSNTTYFIDIDIMVLRIL